MLPLVVAKPIVAAPMSRVVATEVGQRVGLYSNLCQLL